jgi:NAD(P)H-dependent flavin oxidoreductase YrpB (nitropropane dioxygenase family)
LTKNGNIIKNYILNYKLKRLFYETLRIGDISVSLLSFRGNGVGISLSGLASSVANEGGVGVIAAAMIGMGNIKIKLMFYQPMLMLLKSEINKFREKSKGILGVNIMVALTDFGDMVKTAIEEKVDIIFSGAGLPS